MGIQNANVQHPAKWNGQNLLGAALMLVRSDLRKWMAAAEGNIEYIEAEESAANDVWSMFASQVRALPEYGEAVDVYAHIFPLRDRRLNLYGEHDCTLTDIELAMRTNMGGGAPAAWFWEMKQDIYDIARFSGRKQRKIGEEKGDTVVMSKIALINASCADQCVDAVVNAANSGLWAGGGICGVIFQKAGRAELTAACSQYQTPLEDGSAVITPAFQMKNAKCIIHAVGPDFSAKPNAFKELFDAYYNSLCVLKDNGLHSISFPLISSGIFGGALDHPVAESAKQCCRAYSKFITDYPTYPVDVKLCAFSAKEMQDAQAVFSSMITE